MNVVTVQLAKNERMLTERITEGGGVTIVWFLYCDADPLSFVGKWRLERVYK